MKKLYPSAFTLFAFLSIFFFIGNSFKIPTANKAPIFVNSGSPKTKAFILTETWLSFIAERLNNKVLLKWQTEANSHHFIIESSTDGRNFTEIGYISTAGNPSNARNYNFTHNNPQMKNNYYRVQQVDNEGHNSYSDIRMINLNTTASGFMILANPVKYDRLLAQFDKPGSIIIYDATGQVKASQKVVAGSQVIDVSQLSRGIYILKAGSETKKFVVE